MLHKVTLTGADTETEIHTLYKLSQQYPFVEWGILFSYDRMGTPRYPTLKWISQFISQTKMAWFSEGKNEMKSALHLCGSSVQAFLNDDPIINAMASQFGRVQLNFNNVRTPIDLNKIHNKLHQWRMSDRAIITQHNDNNTDLWKLIKSQNHHILFDSSGGVGKLLCVQPPLEDKYCGYAGGISRSNVLEIIDQIDKVNHHLYSIDMESSLRDADGDFDLEMAETILLRTDRRIIYFR